MAKADEQKPEKESTVVAVKEPAEKEKLCVCRKLGLNHGPWCPEW